MSTTLGSYILVNRGHEALEWYKRALGADVQNVSDGPNGKLMHSVVHIGDDSFFVAEDQPEMGGPMMSPTRANGTTFSFYLMVENADKTYDRAMKAGASEVMKPQDAFWGHRWAMFADPYGHVWQVAHVKEELSHEEMVERGKAAMAEMK